MKIITEYGDLVVASVAGVTNLFVGAPTAYPVLWGIWCVAAAGIVAGRVHRRRMER